MYAKSKKIDFINIKLEQFYGPDDDLTKFPLFIIKNCLNNTPELKLTMGTQKRDFIHVEDVISAYSIMISKYITGKNNYYEYELGNGKAVSVREFVEFVHRMTHSKTVLKFGAIPFRNEEIMFSQADIEPLKDLGWYPKYNLEDGIMEIINGVQENMIER